MSIAPSDSASPSLSGYFKDPESDGEPFNLDRSARIHRSSFSRRSFVRPSVEQLQKARTPAELLKLRHPHATTSGSHVDAMESTGDAPLAGAEPDKRSMSSHRRGHFTYHDLMKWIQKEKARRAAAKARKKAEKSADGPGPSYIVSSADGPDRDEAEPEEPKPRVSESSDGETALDMLHEMLEQHLTVQERTHGLRSNRSSKVSLFKKLKRHSTAASSDTDHGESLVPTCEVFLDNTKTLLYAGGAADDESRPNFGRSLSTREKDAWKVFKYEILRLAHTLKLKGWRRVTLESSDSIGVERLSGALTNAVYEVTPPRHLPEEVNADLPRRHRPRRLLLRIYGSQVDHLIDRGAELQILRRLAKKKNRPASTWHVFKR